MISSQRSTTLKSHRIYLIAPTAVCLDWPIQLMRHASHIDYAPHQLFEVEMLQTTTGTCRESAAAKLAS